MISKIRINCDEYEFIYTTKMTKTITFNELRRIKDSLPHGSMQKIADELNLNVDIVRNYFGADHFKEGNCAGIHFESGPEGGIVSLGDTEILDAALKHLGQS